MKAHGDIVLIPGVPQRARLPFLCRVAGSSFAAIERGEGLARGSVSAYSGGRTYLYPRLRQAIVKHLSDRLDIDGEALASYLFGSARAPEAGREQPERQVGECER
jgi:hypothetical protein